MYKTREIIDENRKKFSEFQYYLNIVDKIEMNIEKMPDIAIESCKSLVEGTSKSILLKLGVAYSEKGRNADSPRDLLKKVLNNLPSTVQQEPDFIERTCALIIRISEIRNERGDISHGKSSPKTISSNPDLAAFVAHITDGVVHYLLKIYFNADLSYLEETKYEDNAEFNEMLDEENQMGENLLYSKALFDQDFISYNEQLDYYLSEESIQNQ